MLAWGQRALSFSQLPGPLTVPSQEQMSRSGNRVYFVGFTDMLLVSPVQILTEVSSEACLEAHYVQGQGTTSALGQGTGVLLGILSGACGA